MPPSVRIGDVNNAGGAIISTPQFTVFVNGIFASVIGAPVTPHPPCPVPSPPHCAAVVVSGSPTVFISGIPATRIGDADSCGHVRASGSPTVFIG